MLCSDRQNQTTLGQTVFILCHIKLQIFDVALSVRLLRIWQDGIIQGVIDLTNDDDLSEGCRANAAWALGALANENEANR